MTTTEYHITPGQIRAHKAFLAWVCCPGEHGAIPSFLGCCANLHAGSSRTCSTAATTCSFGACAGGVRGES